MYEFIKGQGWVFTTHILWTDGTYAVAKATGYEGKKYRTLSKSPKLRGGANKVIKMLIRDIPNAALFETGAVNSDADDLALFYLKDLL